MNAQSYCRRPHLGKSTFDRETNQFPTTTGRSHEIEVQLKVPPSTKNRIVFNDAKLITEQIGSGGKYDWAKFIDAETEEELDMVAQRNPQVGRAVI